MLALSGLLILALTVVSGCTRAASEPGRIELSVTKFDFGTFLNTGPVSQVFQVRNVGQGWLEITGVSTSCGCTTAEVASRRLAPGEATDLRVTYDPRVHNGATGAFLRQVYIRSNDPNTPEATLTIRVTVVSPEGTSGQPALDDTDVATLYQAFACPCCGEDIGSCSCGLAEERRDW